MNQNPQNVSLPVGTIEHPGNELLFEFAGPPGSGRTTLLAATLRGLRRQVAVAVIISRINGHRDAATLKEDCQRLLQFDAPRLDAATVRQAMAGLRGEFIDWVFAESCGTCGLLNAAALGRHLTIGIFSVGGGDNKPSMLPELVREADIVLLNQIDLLPHVPFDLAVFHEQVRSLNADVPILGLSALYGHGMAQWIDWLTRCQAGDGPLIHRNGASTTLDQAEFFLG